MPIGLTARRQSRRMYPRGTGFLTLADQKFHFAFEGGAIQSSLEASLEAPMFESYDEKLQRARSMAWSGPFSDMTPYDRAALQAVLERLDDLEASFSSKPSRREASQPQPFDWRQSLGRVLRLRAAA